MEDNTDSGSHVIYDRTTFSTFGIEQANNGIRRLSRMTIIILVALALSLLTVICLTAVIVRQQSTLNTMVSNDYDMQQSINKHFHSLCVRLLSEDQCKE